MTNDREAFRRGASQFLSPLLHVAYSEEARGNVTVITKVTIDAATRIAITSDISRAAADTLYIPATADLDVRAIQLVIRHPFVLPGRTITILARTVEFLPEAAEAFATNQPGESLRSWVRRWSMCKIVTDGTDGKDGRGYKDIGSYPEEDGANGNNGRAERCYPLPAASQQDTLPTAGHRGTRGRHGADGEHGGNAGDIVLAVGSLETRVLLSAFGGNGGNAADGEKGGAGGRGGDGADQRNCGFLGWTEMQNGADAGPGGPGGHGGNGGNGGDAGRGGDITLLAPRAQHLNAYFDERGGGQWGNWRIVTAEPGEQGRRGAGKPGGGPGEPGKGGSDEKYAANTGLGARPPIKRAADGKRRERGSDGRDGRNGNVARKGNPLKIDISHASGFAHLMTETFARRLLHHADSLFIAAGIMPAQSGSKVSTAQFEYAWLRDLLGPFSMSGRFECGVDAAGKPVLTDVLPCGPYAGKTVQDFTKEFGRPTERRVLGEIRALAAARHDFIVNGRDFTGQTGAAVSLMSLEQIKEDLDVKVKRLSEYEQAELAALAEESNDEMARKSARASLITVRSKIDAFEDSLKGLKNANKAKFAELREADELVKSTKRTFMTKAEKLLDALNHSLNLDFETALGILETLSFFPEKGWQRYAMGFSQGGKAVKGLAGVVGMGPKEHSPEQYAVDELYFVNDDFGELDEGWNNLNGELQLKDAGAKLLISRASSMDRVLRPLVRNDVPPKAAANVIHLRQGALFGLSFMDAPNQGKSQLKSDKYPDLRSCRRANSSPTWTHRRADGTADGICDKLWRMRLGENRHDAACADTRSNTLAVDGPSGYLGARRRSPYLVGQRMY